MELEAIVFDIGGVLVEQDDLWPRAAEVFRVPNAAPFRELAHEELLVACRGECTLHEAWSRVAERLGSEVREDVLGRLWVDDYADCIRVRRELMQRVAQLAERHALGVISDTVPEHSGVLDRMGLFESFRDVVLSYEVGLTKGSRAIFELALLRLGTRAARTLFVDDLDRNVESARAAGLLGVVYEDPRQLQRALASYGVLP